MSIKKATPNKTMGYDTAPDVDEGYTPDIRVVDVQDIEVNSWNPNAMDLQNFNMLVETVRKEGMNQPIMVREDKDKPGKFQLVDGEHRFKASKMAGLKKIMVVVVPFSDDLAKMRTISMNHIRGEYIPLRMAKLLADLQKDYSEEEIRRMTGIREEEFSNLQTLLEVPEPDFDGTVTISALEVSRPIHVNLLLMPDEYGKYEEAMQLAMTMAGDLVVPLVGDQVSAYDQAMRLAFGLTGVKLRNLGLAIVCEVFNSIPMELKKDLIEKSKAQFKAFTEKQDAEAAESVPAA